MIPAVFLHDGTVIVDGVEVTMTTADICRHFGVPQPPNLHDKFGVSPIPGVATDDSWDPIIASSLRPSGRSSWAKKTDEIRKSELPIDLALWMTFIKNSLKPSKHHTYADPRVARILYCIQHDLPLDIGRIIQLEILDASRERESGILPFPSLITQFCKDAQVPLGQLQETIPLIDHHTYESHLSAANKLAHTATGVAEPSTRPTRATTSTDQSQQDPESVIPSWATGLITQMTDMNHQISGLHTQVTGLSSQVTGLGSQVSDLRQLFIERLPHPSDASHSATKQKEPEQTRTFKRTKLPAKRNRTRTDSPPAPNEE